MTGIAILRRHQVEKLTGLARATIYERVKSGTFPAPVPLGARSVGWVSTEVDKWIEDRVRARGGK